MLEKLKQVLQLAEGEKITVLGHDNIDFDAFVSGILLSRLLTFLKIPNEFILLEKPRKNATYRFVKEVIGVRMEQYYKKQKEDENRKIILVDHYETFHNGKVLACIDHHIHHTQKRYLFYQFKLSCATAYVIYEMMKLANYECTKQEIQWIMVSMITDTSYFKNGKVVWKEKQDMENVAKQYGLSFETMKKYGLASSKIYGVSLKKVIENGKKEYTFSNKTIASSYLQLGVDGKHVTNFYLNRCLNRLQKQRKKQAIYLWVFIIYDLPQNRTYQYEVRSKGITKRVEKGILSRGTDIMPRIEETIRAENL